MRLGLQLDFSRLLMLGLKQRGLSATDFAKRMHWTDGYVSKLLHSNDEKLSVRVIWKALSALGIRAELVEKCPITFTT